MRVIGVLGFCGGLRIFNRVSLAKATGRNKAIAACAQEEPKRGLNFVSRKRKKNEKKGLNWKTEMSLHLLRNEISR